MLFKIYESLILFAKYFLSFDSLLLLMVTIKWILTKDPLPFFFRKIFNIKKIKFLFKN